MSKQLLMDDLIVDRNVQKRSMDSTQMENPNKTSSMAVVQAGDKITENADGRSKEWLQQNASTAIAV